jgi:predicted 3-demethylubiquinone-9 3-methyltransferase (glyoxalase superfamily)
MRRPGSRELVALKEAEEAARFYASVFPDSRVTRVTAMPSESPAGPPGSVKIVECVLFGSIRR